MKKVLIGALILAAGSLIAAPKNDTVLSNTKGAQLQEDYKKANGQLDEITGILEYLGQVVNKGAVKDNTKKREVRLWILKQLGVVKDMQNIPTIANEQSLVELLRTMRAFIVYLTAALERNLEELEPFESPIIEDCIPAALTQEQVVQVYRTLGQLLRNNQILLKQMNTKINTLGLTATNIWTRWLDGINNRYGITNTLQSLPRTLALLGGAIYLTPYKYFFMGGDEMPGLNWLKRKLGSFKSLDPEGYKDINWYGRGDERPAEPANPAAKPNWTLGSVLNSPEKKLFIGLVGGMAYLLINDPFKEHFEPIRKYLTPRWNKLKGYNLPRIGKYKHPEITLDDSRLIGLDSQIEQMKKIVQYITEPETFDRSASGLEKGILLTGPSRCGKTLLANALCGTINEEMHKKGMLKQFGFKQVKWSEIRWGGDGIQTILEDAKKNAPCVIFLDEIHNLPLQIKEGGEVLTQFLTLGDSLMSTGLNDAVIVLAATNRPYALDDALLKPGRFGMHIHFDKPTFDLRKKAFLTKCANSAINTEAFDLDQLARLTKDCSYGDLEMIFKGARFIARSKNRSLRQQDFLDNIYEQVYRIRFDQELPLTEDAHKLVATHLAGHALFYMYYEKELNERLEVVTTRGQWSKIEEKRYLIDDVHQAHEQQKTVYGHLFTSKASEVVDLGASPEIKAKMLLAGAIAEEILLGSSAKSYHPDDTREALQVLEDYTFGGLSAQDYTKEELTEPKREAKLLLEQCKSEVRTLLLHEKEALARLSEALQQKLLLSYTEVKEILEISKK